MLILLEKGKLSNVGLVRVASLPRHSHRTPTRKTVSCPRFRTVIEKARTIRRKSRRRRRRRRREAVEQEEEKDGYNYHY